MNEDAALHNFHGIGAKTEELFHKIGIDRAGDLLLYFPRDYMVYPEAVDSTEDLETGKKAALRGFFKKSPVTHHYRSMDVTIGLFYLGTRGDKAISVFWYRMPYISRNIRIASPYVIYGTVQEKNGEFRLEQPALFSPQAYQKETDRLLPVYSLTKGISNQKMTKTVEEALNLCLPLEDPLVSEEDFLSKENILPLGEAIRNMHFPESEKALSDAIRRFSYQEFLVFFLSVRMEEKGLAKEKNDLVLKRHEIYDQIMEELPFSLTRGQKQALEDLNRDFCGSTIEERLIQGDVGSGKTIVAFLSMVRMAENGYQAAIMAPTEVLAAQHEKTFQDLIDRYKLPFHIAYLTGSLKAAERRKALASIADGSADFIIGTHALIQEGVSYHALALVITDEQHRFGVKQRDTFLRKGQHPFSIVMSATPIPRTLALILYNGMQVSTIHDVPSERLRVKTAVISDEKRPTAWNFIRKEVAKGHQAYIICPLVMASENLDQENVTDYGKNLSEYLKGEAKVGILHGRMKAEEKEEVMRDFALNKIQILVSTTVVEVGVNVPNATVMMVENADHFGLAQLHQLRGRVGRGQWQSYCILMNSQKKNADHANKRLDIMNHSYDGFEIAEEDLKLRGPGDARGIRQSGDSAFTMADIYRDSDLLKLASQHADQILSRDPKLEEEGHKGLRKLVDKKADETYTNL
ncbi:MAG: ATP-dependent DNA helicase RecG [Lachnospiraceae bacterium]|nr:ATP-dependent DNA helicase RecG [Lachnospiraceae bacterium]